MEEEECSFFEKKEPKKLLLPEVRRAATRASRRKSFLLLFFKKEVLFFLFFPALAFALDGPQPELPTQKLTIVSQTGAKHVFTVEIASTPLEQEIGEMYRTNIPADRGMFFDWGTPREVPMWMKNCPVPEDMVFIGEDGTITHIAENTVPESETNISSGGPVRATLELQGGITEKLDIEVGDRIEGVIFGK